MSITEIGCCGAYCRTCPAFHGMACKGCKTGYENNGRDLSKARCKIKVCCISRQHQSCSDCSEYAACGILDAFYGKNGHKYRKYKQATEYIRENGYAAFLAAADTWTNAYGKLNGTLP